MTARHHDPTVPRPVLLGALILVVASIVLVALARSSRVGLLIGSGDSPPVEVIKVQFEDRSDGAVVARDPDTGRILKVYPPGGQGFIRGVLRSMARQRKLASVGKKPPVNVARWSDGRLALRDPETGFFVDLRAFGSSNSAVFAALFTGGFDG